MGIKGIRELKAKLLAMQGKLEREVKEVVLITLSDIQLEAIRLAPGPGDPIKTQSGQESQRDIVGSRGWTAISQNISYEVNNDGLSGSVFVERGAGEIAAWVEFGTGQSASSYLSTVEPEWRSIAQLYYINGKGTIINQPYLYPAYLIGKIEFVKELKDVVKNINK